MKPKEYPDETERRIMKKADFKKHCWRLHTHTHTHTRARAHVWTLRYGFGRGIPPACLIHDCFPSFWSETWKREFCPEKKQNGWTHQYPDNTRLPIQQVDAARGDRDDKLHKDVLFWMAVRAILLHCFFFYLYCLDSFMWELWRCYFYVPPRGENTQSEKKKNASHRRGFSACECLKRSKADAKQNQITMTMRVLFLKTVCACFYFWLSFLLMRIYKCLKKSIDSTLTTSISSGCLSDIFSCFLG